METIAEINNFAATCIDANRLRDAVDILALALQFIRKKIYHLGSPNFDEDSHACPSSSQTTMHAASNEEAPPYHPLTSLPSLTGSPHTRVATIIMPHGNVQGRDFDQKPFHFSSALKYHHPFWAFQEMNRYTTSNGSTVTFMSKSESHATLTIRHVATLIFNCALCHDFLVSSALTSSQSKVLRDKAVSLYGQVVNLYLESIVESCIEEDSITNSLVSSSPRRPRFVRAQQDITVMAAVNNLIQLHDDSSQERKYYSQLMIALFQYIQGTDYGSEEIRSQVDSQARVFVSNTILSGTWENSVVGAAAAA